MDRVVVTGALGNVGSTVVAELLARGALVRAADIDPDALQRRFGETVEAARLDFADPGTFGPVLAGAGRVFLIRRPAISRVGPTLNRFLDAAAAAAVEQVVFSSVAGRSPTASCPTTGWSSTSSSPVSAGRSCAPASSPRTSADHIGGTSSRRT